MTSKLFGTDGIRGDVLSYPITPDFMMRFAAVCGDAIYSGIFGAKPGNTTAHSDIDGNDESGATRPLVIMGCDTRASCCMLELALMYGFRSRGIGIEWLGCIPTPAVGYMVRARKAACGVMVSSSHNACHTNGIKLFDSEGYKLSAISESLLEQKFAHDHVAVRENCMLPGSLHRILDAEERYVDFIQSIFKLDLSGIKIVLDCSNGAASSVAARILEGFGADVIVKNAQPNGFNVNLDCGVLAIDRGICKSVIEYNADFGIAIDGDGDRVVICDANGSIANGDQILAGIALEYKRGNILRGNGVVCTILTNSALEKLLSEHGIKMIRSDVGERSVIDMMLGNGLILGGENSGHLIISDPCRTSDAIVTALTFLDVAIKNQGSVKFFEPYPQIMVNIPNYRQLKNRDMIEYIDTLNRSMSGRGRVVVRESGTEPVIRIMVEYDDSQLASNIVSDIVKFMDIRTA